MRNGRSLPAGSASESSRRSARPALLDVDGVLLDSADLYRRVWATWSRLVGLDVEAVWKLTQGRRPADTIAAAAPQLAVEREYQRLGALLREDGGKVGAMPGALELLQALPVGSWALVTSNSEEAVRQAFRQLGLPQPQLVVDQAAVAVGKPSPEGYLAAAAALVAAPADCLVVEDSPAGAEAGRSAGMTVLGLASTHPPEQLGAAHLVLPDLLEASSLILGWVAGRYLPGGPGRGRRTVA